MIRVTYREASEVLSLTMEGHAGSAEYGHDLVCASASMLAYTLALHVDSLDKTDALKDSPIVSLLPGDARVITRPFPEAYGKVRDAYRLIADGYELLSKHYPKFVSFIYDATPERV